LNPRTAYISLGSNLGDRAQWLRRARAELAAAVAAPAAAAGRVPGLRASAIYETAPVGPVAQGAFLNQVVAVEWAGSARELLELGRRIEAACGRERRVRWGPRTLDFDILMLGDERVDEPDLELPHPRMLERAFVLVPLAELAADHVIAGMPVAQWLERTGCAGVVRWDV